MCRFCLGSRIRDDDDLVTWIIHKGRSLSNSQFLNASTTTILAAFRYYSIKQRATYRAIFRSTNFCNIKTAETNWIEFFSKDTVLRCFKFVCEYVCAKKKYFLYFYAIFFYCKCRNAKCFTVFYFWREILYSFCINFSWILQN